MIVRGITSMKEIERLQKYLLLIRRSVGWTASEFGDRIGVTRQTINNLESGRSKLTKTQYIAIRSVLDAEMNKYPSETKMLGLILEVFVDNPQKYNSQKKQELLEKANMLTPSILAGTSDRKSVSDTFLLAATILGFVMPFLIDGVSAWLKNLLQDDD